MFRFFLDHHQGAGHLHSQQRIPTQHDMLPHHNVYRNELNCKCYNITLTRNNKAP